MVPITKITGRLGNQMFEFAALYAMTRDLGVDYYVQDEKFFSKYKDEIRLMYGQGIKYIDRVSIHVRRGDYVRNPFYVDLSKTDYYATAIAMFPNDKFLVFSDDIEWCKEYFEGDMFEFAEDNDEVGDLNMMAGCKHNIIANSSFSWWAAWLNPNPRKLVIAPKAWHPDRVERTKLPDSWIRL
jgi:hypothetical protein